MAKKKHFLVNLNKEQYDVLNHVYNLTGIPIEAILGRMVDQACATVDDQQLKNLDNTVTKQIRTQANPQDKALLAGKVMVDDKNFALYQRGVKNYIVMYHKLADGQALKPGTVLLIRGAGAGGAPLLRYVSYVGPQNARGYLTISLWTPSEYRKRSGKNVGWPDGPLSVQQFDDLLNNQIGPQDD